MKPMSRRLRQQSPPGLGVAAGEPPAEPPAELPAEPPAVAKAGTATVKIRCPKCGEELLPKTLRYSHDCDMSKKPRPSGEQLIEEDPILEPHRVRARTSSES